MKEKEKVISVLTYPFENGIVVKVTRATGYFDYPQHQRVYQVTFDSKALGTFAYWTGKMMFLHHVKMVTSLQKNYLEKRTMQKWLS